MIKIHRKMVEEKEIIGDEIIIKECYEETEEFISLEQQISILKKAKTDKIYFRQNYKNLIEFEWDLIRELGNENWNENWHKYFESDEDLLELVENLKFLRKLPDRTSNPSNYLKIIFSEIYRRGLDKPEHLDLVNVKELGWTKYDNFQSSTDYIKFNENIIILLKYGKDNIHLNYLEEQKIKNFGHELSRKIGRSENITYQKYFPSNNDKINLFRGLILLERLKGDASSGVPSIKVFQVIQRLKLDTPGLLDWTFKYKSNNSYTPFGESKYGHIRSYKEYLEFLDEESFRASKQTQNIANKKKRIVEKTKKHKEKLEMQELSNLVFYSKIDEYLKDKKKDILNDIINKNLSFPLFILTEDIIEELIPKLLNLHEESLQKLVQIIPRKYPVHIRVLRMSANQILLKRNETFLVKIKNLIKSMFY